MITSCTRAVLAGAAMLALATAAAAQGPGAASLTLYDQPDYRGGSVTFYGDHANIGSTGIADRARSAQVRGTWRLCEGGGYRNRCEVLSGNVRDLSAYGLAGRVGSAQLVSGQRYGANSPPAPRAYAPAPAYPPPAVERNRVQPQPYAQDYPRQADPYPAPRPYTRPYDQPQTPADNDRAYPPAAGPRTYAAPYPQPSARPYEPPARDGYARAPDPSRSYVPPLPGGRSGPFPYGEPAVEPPASEDVLISGAAPGQVTVFFASPLMNGAPVSAARLGAADRFCRSQGLAGAVWADRGGRAPRAMDVDGRIVGPGPVLRDVLCRRY